MGCLIEIIGEAFVEIIVEGWCRLMCLVLPEDKLSPKKYKLIKGLVAVWCVVLFVSVIIGLIIATSSEVAMWKWGLCLIIIPIVSSALQIIIGIIFRFTRKRREKESDNIEQYLNK